MHGLVALMEIQASRSAPASVPTGEPVLLLDQDRSPWDHLLIRRGLAALDRAEQLGGALGPYALQAAIAACHARAATAEETDWARIAALYDELAQLTPVAGGGAEPGGGRRDGVRSGGRPGAGRRRWATSRRWRATTCCRACAATCWPSWAGSTRRGPSSSGRRRSRAIRASGS